MTFFNDDCFNVFPQLEEKSIDENIEKAVKNNPSEREIEKAAAGQNILNMRQDGIIKVLQGITSLEEVDRVIEI